MRRGLIKSGEKLPKPNTFIGGIAVSFGTPEALATRLVGVTADNIQNFQVDEFNNVSCFIDKDYSIGVRGNNIGGIVPYFIDLGGRATSIEGSGFQGQVTTALHTPNVSSLGGGYTFQSTRMKYINLPLVPSIGTHFAYRSIFHQYFRLDSCHTIGNTNVFRPIEGCNKKRIYLPNVTTYGSTLGIDGIFTNINTGGVKIYVHPSMLTINGGGLEGDLAYAQNSRNAIIIPVTDFTKPNAVTDLIVSDLTATTATLFFTPPASANALDFYMVWLESDLHPVNSQAYFNERYNPLREITGSGAVITSLTPGTNYKIRIVACDEFWNESENSNEVVFSTTEMPYNIISYWRMQNNVLDSVSSNNGTATGVTYAVGLVGQAAVLSGGTNSGIVTPLNLGGYFVNEVNNFAIFCAFRPTTIGTNDRVIFGYGGGTGSLANLALFVTSTGSLQTVIRGTYTTLMNITTGTWYTVCLYVNGTVVKININGTVYTLNVGEQPSQNIANGLCFGTTSNGTVNLRFIGSIDEAGVSNSVLTDVEAQEIITTLQSGQSVI